MRPDPSFLPAESPGYYAPFPAPWIKSICPHCVLALVRLAWKCGYALRFHLVFTHCILLCCGAPNFVWKRDIHSLALVTHILLPLFFPFVWIMETPLVVVTLFSCDIRVWKRLHVWLLLYSGCFKVELTPVRLVVFRTHGNAVSGCSIFQRIFGNTTGVCVSFLNTALPFVVS